MDLLATRLAHYAAVFAADAGTDALYHNRWTGAVSDLCVAVAQEAINRKAAADAANVDFYPLAFVESAALALAANHAATLEQLFDAGQADVDALLKDD